MEDRKPPEEPPQWLRVSDESWGPTEPRRARRPQADTNPDTQKPGLSLVEIVSWGALALVAAIVALYLWGALVSFFG